jgi:VWFA-related protein
MRHFLLLAAVAATDLRPGFAGPPQQDSAVIRVSSNLVSVPVLVMDAAGRPVRTLTAADFRLETDGRPQRIVQLGEPGAAPVEMALLLDVSGSVSERFSVEREAASRFLQAVLRPVDSVALFTVGREAKLVLPRTADVAAAIAAVNHLHPTREATSFYDAVVKAAEYLGDGASPGARRALVVISDGEDTFSAQARFEDALRAVQRADVLFYAINPSGALIRLNQITAQGHERLTTLAADIGGAYLIDHPEELKAALEKIAAELQAQYLLGFYAGENGAPGSKPFRRIAVSVPLRPELRIRARQGFFEPKFRGD